MRTSLVCVIVTLAMCLAMNDMLMPLAMAQQQVQIQGLIMDESSGEDLVVLPPPPRELRRAISEAESAMQDGRHSEAIDALNELLQRDEVEDYFLSESSEGVSISLKRKALELLGSMSDKAREIYELESGRDARRQLELAINRGNIQGIADVSRQFFHTDAGYEATLILARHELDRGKPIAAAMRLERLIDAPEARDRFADELRLQLAVCWHLAGQHERASSALTADRATSSLLGKTVTIADQPQTVPKDREALSQWLRQMAGDTLDFGSSADEDWPLIRGNPARTASVSGGMPLASLEWELESSIHRDEYLALTGTYQSFLENGIVAMPMMQPLAVGDQLLMRTGRLLWGVPIESGIRLWPFPDDQVPSDSDSVASELSKSPQQQLRLQTVQQFVQQRFWQDAPFSGLSSDGERVFLLDEMEAVVTNQPTRNFGGMFGATHSTISNRLVALELSSQGKIIWTVGGPDGEDERLRDAFFLGAPLPLSGSLYVIAEIKDEIRLVVLDAATGALQWSQQLAQVEIPIAFQIDMARRLCGASPSYADGVLVCPTSSGVAVAIDLVDRTLRWGYRCEPVNQPNRNRRPAGWNIGGVMRSLNIGEHWADSFAIIHDGYVLLTPVKSDRLHCIDLLTGKEKWAPQRRGDALFIGAVHENVILIVEKSGLRGLDLATGRACWNPIELDPEEAPSGRGFLADGYYFLPTTQAQIIKIDLQTGTVVERHATERILGNLICHGDYLISQNADRITAYALRDQRRIRLAEQLKINPDDPRVLEDYASLLSADGNRSGAIEALQKAIELSTDEDQVSSLKTSLFATVVDALRFDFPAYETLVDTARSLARSNHERLVLSEVIAEGLRETDRHVFAFEAYIEVADWMNARGATTMGQSLANFRQMKGDWRKNESLRLAESLASLLEKATAGERSEMLIALANRLESLDVANATESLELWLTILPSLQPFAQLDSADSAVLLRLVASTHRMRMVLAEHFLLTQPLAVERLLADIDTSTANHKAEAQALYAECLVRSGNIANAGEIYARLIETKDDQIVRNGQTGRELAEQFDASHPDASQSPSIGSWKQGKVDVRQIAADPMVGNRQWIPVDLISASPDWPLGYRLVIDATMQTLLILDAMDNVVMELPIEDHFRPIPLAIHAKIDRHLLVISLGDRMLAYDLLKAVEDDGERLLWEVSLTGGGPLPADIIGRRMTVPSRNEDNPFLESQMRFGSSVVAPMGRLGPVSLNSVCIHRGGELHCYDGLTGELRWMRRDVDYPITLGDDEHVLAVRGSGEMRIFRTHDGKEMGKVQGPLVSHHITSHGRFVLYYDGTYATGNDLELKLYDPINDEVVWSRPTAAKSKACIVERDELAIMQPDGVFAIVHIEDGELIFETTLLPEPGLLPCFVVKSKDQYLVITNRNDQRKLELLQRRGIQLQINQVGQQIPKRITGNVYSLDPVSGKMLWKAPVPVGQFGMIYPQPAEMPILIFQRRVQPRGVPGNLRQRTNDQSNLVVLDRRDGKIIYERHDLPFTASHYGLQADVARNQIVLSLLGEKSVELTFTNVDSQESPGVLPAVEVPQEPPAPDGTSRSMQRRNRS